MGAEGEYQPGANPRVLRNLRGVSRKREMDQLEMESLLRAQTRYLAVVTSKTRFSAEFIRRMHQSWLGRIYPWAGNYRTVEVSKGGFTWPPAYLVPQNMEKFESSTLRPL